jgi:hypothetical protein
MRWLPFFRRPAKHATRSVIPKREQSKRILGAARNPYDLYVSEYRFAWWKRPEYLRHFRKRVPDFPRRYSNFPDLEFAQWIELHHEAFCRLSRDQNFSSDEGVGFNTQRFVDYYLTMPQEVLERGVDAFDLDEIRHDLDRVDFIRTGSLNEDLYDYLGRRGLAHRDIGFIRAKPRVLPEGKGRSDGDDWRSYYTPALRQIIRRKDRLLFSLFPEFDL